MWEFHFVGHKSSVNLFASTCGFGPRYTGFQLANPIEQEVAG
jgi:hypothetical protein